MTGHGEKPLVTEVVVDGQTLSYGDVVAVAHHGAQVALADGVLARLAGERAVVDEVVDRQIPTYGLTTGLGGPGALTGAGDDPELPTGAGQTLDALPATGNTPNVLTRAGDAFALPTSAGDTPDPLPSTGAAPQEPAATGMSPETPDHTGSAAQVSAPGSTGEILSSGNFHTPALALAFDTLALALTQTAAISAERMRRLLDPAVSGLPANLSPYGPERSGFAPLVKTAQALVAEVRMLAVPVCIDPRQGADSVEDDSTNAALGARRLTTMLGRLRQLLAVEAVVAAQAVDLAAPGTLGRGPEFLYRAIRKRVPTLDDDRPHGVDVETVSRDILGSDDVRSTLNALAGEAT
ncbi:aromatic amino acid lyase [Streptomyces sp. NPDC048504]|uniref:aromatic amino acid lyase n=1 Tax=Streptomyces sp. NPDC048504 TaxID=3365559 RepID=UPI003713B91C